MVSPVGSKKIPIVLDESDLEESFVRGALRFFLPLFLLIFPFLRCVASVGPDVCAGADADADASTNEQARDRAVKRSINCRRA